MKIYQQKSLLVAQQRDLASARKWVKQLILELRSQGNSGEVSKTTDALRLVQLQLKIFAEEQAVAKQLQALNEQTMAESIKPNSAEDKRLLEEYLKRMSATQEKEGALTGDQ